MNLVASLITRDELGRYLEPCIESLQSFCDEIRVLDDGSQDGTREWLREQDGVSVRLNDVGAMFEHEGRARQRLLDWTLAAEPAPDWILAVDADEIVTDGVAVRAAVENDVSRGAYTLEMVEIWKADDGALWSREDGGWRAHPVPVLYRAGPGMQIQDRQLACGREPLQVRKLAVRAPASHAQLLHLGWLNESERAARHQRYVVADGGRFHAGSHLASILYPDNRVRLKRREWPNGVQRWRERIVERAQAVTA